MTISSSVTESIVPWEFDKTVAHIFQAHALKHIPDYQKVIDLSIQITLNIFGTEARVLDFGSALGYTIDQFNNAGIESVYGIEKSNDMIQSSLFPERVILDDKIPENMGSFDVIIANWTLHFIEYRAPIIHSFYSHLNQGGVIIITDKIASSTYIHDLYIDFKRKNGLSEEEIQKKTESLKGVLFSYSLEYYLSIFQELGLTVDIINTTPCFITFALRKTNI